MMSLWSRLFGTKYSAAGWAQSLYYFGRPVWTPRNYEKFATEAYQKNVIAYACISKLASAIASVPLYIMDGEKEIDVHPLLDLLNAPNPFMSYPEFMETIASYYMIAGNSYIERVDSFSKKQLTGANVPSELYPLRPDRMRILPDKNGWPGAYEYVIGGSVTRYDLDVARHILPVLHIKSFNPTDDWYGLSMIEAAMYSIDTHTEASAWNKSLLHNSGTPSGMLKFKSLTKPQREDVKLELSEKFSGPNNAGRPMLAEGQDGEWVPMGFSPKDMEWINSKNVSAREICLALKTPPQVLGIPGDNTYSNLQEANVAFARNGVLPLLHRIVGGLNRWLCPDFGPGVRLCFDEDSIPGLAQERRDIYAKLEATSFLTTNEKRDAAGFEEYESDDVEGAEPVKKKAAGDYILVGTSLMVLDDIIAPPPAPAVDPNGEPIDPNADPVPPPKPPKASE